jgi:hypothetical protein
MICRQWTTDGRVVRLEQVDPTTKMFELWVEGVLVEGPRPLTVDEWKEWGPEPLDKQGVLATLLAVSGVVPVEDAANAVGLTPDDLVAEAQAWAVAGS